MNSNIIDELKLLNFAITSLIKIIDKYLDKMLVNNNLINMITKHYRRIFNDDFILSINCTNQMFIKTINISITNRSGSFFKKNFVENF